MNPLRGILALIVFIIGIGLLGNILLYAFNWITLGAAITCFIAAYFIWPSNKRGKRDDDNGFLDLLVMIIELPVEFILWLLRFIKRLIGSSDVGGVDF